MCFVWGANYASAPHCKLLFRRIDDDIKAFSEITKKNFKIWDKFSVNIFSFIHNNAFVLMLSFPRQYTYQRRFVSENPY